MVGVKGGAWVSGRQKKASLCVAWQPPLLRGSFPLAGQHRWPHPAMPSVSTTCRLVARHAGQRIRAAVHVPMAWKRGRNERPTTASCLLPLAALRRHFFGYDVTSNAGKDHRTHIPRTSSRLSMSTTKRPGYWTCWQQQGGVSTRACHTRPFLPAFDLPTP